MSLLLRVLLYLLVDFVIIASWERLVTKEVDFLILGEELKTIGLVPADWEHIKRNLSTNGISQPNIRELLANSSDELFTNLMHMVVLLEVVPFGL